MFSEGMQSIPRKNRPQPEDLEGYERQYPLDPDLTLYRREGLDWLYDYRREEEEKRERQESQRETLPGHEPNDYLVNGGRRGFDRDSFDLDLDRAVRTVQSRPQH